MRTIHISIISPVYKAEKIVSQLVNRITNSIEPITLDYEIILVEDNSPDNSWYEIEKICKTNNKVKGIKLSKNFGQHKAITAGIEHSMGEWVVVMDCDLQDQPEEIPKLFNKAKEGFDVVLAKRKNRKDNFIKKLFSKLFYAFLTYLTGTNHDPTIANFGIYHKKVINAVCSMKESIRYFPTMIKWVGFKQTKIAVEHAERVEGKTSYNFKKLLNLALDIILAYSDKPIRIMIKLGFLISFMGLIFALIVFIRFLGGKITVSGYASLIISIWVLSGIIIMMLGIVGLYVGKTFEGVKNRPIYIIDTKLNL